MNFPKKVTFKLAYSETSKPVSNVAILLTLYAHRKNNYSVGTKISNEEGLVAFTKEDCLKVIRSSKSFYLMDYSSNLKECLPRISIEIREPKQIDSMVKRRRRFAHIYKDYWNCSESYLKKLERCDNALYKPETFTFSEEELWKNKVIEIKVHRQPQK